MRRSMRLIAVLLVVGAVGFGASAALGTTGSSTAGNLSFSVTAPDSVTKGQSLAYSGSVSNNSASAVDAYVQFTVTGPNGNSRSGLPYVIHVGAGQTLSRSGSYTVPLKAPSGQYTVTMKLTIPNSASGQTSAQSSVS